LSGGFILIICLAVKLYREGNYLDYSVDLACAVSDRMSLSMSFNQRFYSKTKQDEKVESGRKPLELTPIPRVWVLALP
jgi:hypothetical protein